ncbi:MAG: four-carbon acid sugar kinase family protein, partial [Rhodobacterales bacterium]|nr:four-carbon acid sugar kinase family protein [Rhodobacterales bacterium]
ADALNARQVLVCPAFPAAGRSIYQGHLFVADKLLSESGMQNHPLTPMTDPDIRRWLGHQIKGTVGHVPAQTVMQGVQSIRNRMQSEDRAGHRLLVADAITDHDLVTLGESAADLPLITGGSGIAMGLPGNFCAKGLLSSRHDHWSPQKGRAAILSGSCSNATRGQVAEHARTHPALEVTADQVMSGALTVQALADWALSQDGLPLIYTSADPAVVADAQARFGKETVAARIEALFAELARALVAGGVTRLISAGGETSGAVVEGLALNALEIGPEIDPGVPMIRARDNLVLALKSGNFGGPDFFARAAAMMEGQTS